MAEKTHINWADATWNPWMGCTKVSAGCKNCYMFRDMPKYGKDPSVVVRSKTKFTDPLKWAKAKKIADDSRIFTCSWSDWFHPDADDWRGEAWDIVKRTPYTYLILTKRPERIAFHLPDDWGNGYPNVWLGISVETQEIANKRWRILGDKNLPAAVKFFSYEPALGPLSLYDLECVYWPDWIISGGESDQSNPRPASQSWFMTLRDQCIVQEIPFWHKQHGGSKKIDGEWGGRKLEGYVWEQLPT